MAEPSAIWAAKRVIFDSSISHAQNVILFQGASALSTLIEHIHRVRELFATGGLANACVDPRLGSLLSDLCNQQGLASTILFDETTRTRENAAARTLRVDRVSYVKSRTMGAHISVLNDRKVRNTLVHVDEYLATALRRPNTGWHIDLGVASRNEFVPPEGLEVAFCRCYIADEDVLLHLDNEINLTVLEQEAKDILRLVFDDPGLDSLGALP